MLNLTSKQKAYLEAAYHGALVGGDEGDRRWTAYCRSLPSNRSMFAVRASLSRIGLLKESVFTEEGKRVAEAIATGKAWEA